MKDDHNVDPSQVLKVAAVACANCGHVRLHATRALGR